MDPFCYMCSMSVILSWLEKGRPLGSFVFAVFLCFVTFPNGVLGQVWHLIISISDLCILPTLMTIVL